MSLLYLTIIMAVVFGFASLALDFGRVQLAKTQLHIVADSAAKYAVRWVGAGATKAAQQANVVTNDNKVAGEKITFAAGDVQVGYWTYQNRTFTANARPRNAVKLTHVKAVPLALGQLIGKQSSRVRATAVASCVPMSIVGLNSINFKNNTFAASYDSSVQKNPNTSNYNSNVTLVSNGYIGEQNNGNVKGDCITGPAGSVDTFAITGAIGKQGSAIPAPADPAWNPSSNPGGVVQNNYTHSNNAPLPGGTYWFSGTLRIHAKMRFNAPTTIYINGDVVQNDIVEAYQQTPANLKIYQIGAGRTWVASNDISMTAQVVAPRSDFTANNNWKFYGACIFHAITTRNNAEFYYDETLDSVAAVSVVQ